MDNYNSTFGKKVEGVVYNTIMKKFLGLVLLVIILGYFLGNLKGIFKQNSNLNKTNPISSVSSTIADTPNISVLVNNLEIPWSVAFLPASPAGGPDGSMLVTERPGRVRHIVEGQIKNTFNIDGVKHIGEGGLMGLTLHPDFSSNNFIYLYYTYNSTGNDTLNRAVRMTWKDNKLVDEKILVDRIPGASNHNGGRIKFGPDKLLYIATGDAQEPSQAQDKNTLGGKILRVTDEGKAAPGNPFGNLVYSYGHRNVQGLAWDNEGKLWATEHGQSGLDELNLIESGKNYGWPEIQGDETRGGMETPRKNSGSTTWAPAGAAFIGNRLFFAGLRGATLYEAVINNGEIIEIKEYFKGEFGRIREVILGPDGMLYITTSNRDGRGNPAQEDDKIIRINPGKL